MLKSAAITDTGCKRVGYARIWNKTREGYDNK